MKKFLFFLIVIACVGGLAHALTYDQANYIKHFSAQGSPKGNNPVYNFIGEVDGLIGGEKGTGKIFYVDSGLSSSGNGTSWALGKLTLDEAIDLCVADRGDVIYVAQGHKEVEATAATSLFTLDVAGVSIIAISNGGYEATVSAGVITLNQRPTLVLDAADATITVSAKHCRVSGFLIVSDIDNVAIGITLAATADGSIIDNCVFRDNAANLDLLVAINVVADCDAIQLVNNKFFATAASTSDNAILLLGGSDQSIISGNLIYGTYTDGGILASAAASVNLTVIDNVIGAIDAIAYAGSTTTTGLFARNLLGANTTSIAAALTGVDTMFCFENYVSGALNASGLLDPGADVD